MSTSKRQLCTVCNVTKTLKQPPICHICAKSPTLTYNCKLCNSKTKNETQICARHNKKNKPLQTAKPFEQKVKVATKLINHLKSIDNPDDKPDPEDIEEIKAHLELRRLLKNLTVEDMSRTSSTSNIFELDLSEEGESIDGGEISEFSD